MLPAVIARLFPPALRAKAESLWDAGAAFIPRLSGGQWGDFIFPTLVSFLSLALDGEGREVPGQWSWKDIEDLLTFLYGEALPEEDAATLAFLTAPEDAVALLRAWVMGWAEGDMTLLQKEARRIAEEIRATYEVD